MGYRYYKSASTYELPPWTWISHWIPTLGTSCSLDIDRDVAYDEARGSWDPRLLRLSTPSFSSDVLEIYRTPTFVQAMRIGNLLPTSRHYYGLVDPDPTNPLAATSTRILLSSTK